MGGALIVVAVIAAFLVGGFVGRMIGPSDVGRQCGLCRQPIAASDTTFVVRRVMHSRCYKDASDA